MEDKDGESLSGEERKMMSQWGGGGLGEEGEESCPVLSSPYLLSEFSDSDVCIMPLALEHPSPRTP